jgi:autotransporter-associated beta strand protein
LNTGSATQPVGAIEALSTRTTNTVIGNSTGSKAGTLILNGATVNSVSNVVLRNAGSGTTTLLNTGFNGSGLAMGVSLGNTTENVILLDSSGGITISSTITGANRRLVLAGSGTGTLLLSASNTYSGTNTLNNANSVWKLANANALGANGNALVMTTGTLDLASFSPTIGSLSGAGGRITNSTASTTATVTATSTVTGTFAGTIVNGSGTTAFTKQGAGTLVFTGANTYSGLTTISGGVLQIGDGTTVGSIAGNVSNSGTLSFNRSNSLAYSGTISGAGAVVQAGSGDTTLSGNSSGFAGTTTVSAGTLKANGNLGGTVSVSSGATLAGSGTVGAVAITTGATLSPGTSPGTLTTGNMTLAGGGNYNWQLFDATGSAGTAYDTISGTGSLTINATSGSPFAINVWTLSGTGPDVNGNAINFSPTTNYTWSLGTFSGGISGFAADAFTVVTGTANGTGGFSNTFDPSTGTFSVAQSGNSLNLVYTYADPGASWNWTAGTGNWSGASNWSPATVPSGTATLTFSGAGGTSTNDIALPRVGSLTFTDSAGAYTIGGNDLNMGSSGITNSSSATQTISANVTLATAASFTTNGGGLAFSGTVDNAGYGLTVTGSGNTTLGVVSGTGGLTKTGVGTATLNGSLASPTVAVSAGSLTLGSSNVLADTAAVTVSGGGFDLSSFSDTAGSFTITSGTLGGSGTLTAATYALQGGTVAGNLGAGTATASSGTTALNGTLAGDLAVSGGTVNLGAADRLGNASAVTISSGSLGIGADNDTVGSFTISGGALGGAGTLTAATYSLGGGTVAGNLGAGTATSSSGSTALNGTLAGALTVAGGTVSLGSADRISGASTVTISSGSLGLGANSDTVGSFTISGGSLGGAGTLTAATYSLGGGTVAANLGAGTATSSSGSTALNGTLAGALTVAGGTVSLGSADRISGASTVTISSGSLGVGTFADTVGSFTISGGVIGGSGTLTAATYALQGGTVTANLGAGTLTASSGATTLSGSSAATTVNVNSGTLALGAASRLADSAALAVAGGTLDTTVSNYADTVGSFAISSGEVGGGGTITAATYALTGGTVNANLGAGTLNANSGAATLNGTAAATTVNVAGGTLSTGGANKLSDTAAVTVSSGGLSLGGDDTVGTMTQSGGTLGGAGKLSFTSYTAQGGSISTGLAGAGTFSATSGATTLSGNGSTFTGPTAVSGGSVTLAAGNALGSGTVSMSGGSLYATNGQTVANNFTIGASGSSAFYTQNFNGLGSGLPAGWTTATGATASAGGTSLAFTTAAVSWADTGAAFKNYASATGLSGTSSPSAQSTSIDRALGVRPSGSFGDPGAAFRYAFSTTGQTIDSISIDMMLLDEQGRSTTWTLQYGSGTSPSSFTTLGTWADPGTWGTTTVTYSGTAVSGMSNLANGVFRVIALTPSAGSGSRDSIGIDNFQINTPTVTPAAATLGTSEATSVLYSGNLSLVSTSTATLTAVAGGTATFSGIISGTAGSIIKTGLGTVILNGTNTYAAGTNVSAGTLKAGNSNSFGSGSVTLSAGATLDLNSLTFANTITNNGGTLANAGSFSGSSSVSGTADYSGAVGGTVVVDAGGVANFSGSINSLTVSAGGQANLNDGSSLIQATLTNDGLLVANRSSDTTFSTAIGGSGAFEKLGSGILTVTGNSTYSGATTVSAGRLKVNGSLGSGGLSVAASAWLMGTGTVNGPVTVSGTFSPGSSPGVITLGSLVLTSTSTTIIEVLGATRGTSYDGIDIATASGLTYGGLLSFEFGGSALPEGTYDIFNFAGTSSGSFASLDSTGFYAGTWTNNSNGSFTLVKDAQTLTFSQSTGDIIVVPEPGTLALAAAGAAALAAALRRRR